MKTTSTQNMPTLSGSLAGVLTDFLDAERLPARACRARLALWKPDGRISAIEWGICLFLIAQEDARPALGLEIARYFQPEHGGLFAYTALSCDNIGELLAQFDRIHRLMWQGFDITIHQSNDTLTISWTTQIPISPDILHLVGLAYETGIAGIVQIFRMLCGVRHSPCAVTLQGLPPRELGPYEAFFRCPVTFSDRTSSLSFSTEILHLPITGKETVLKELIERQTKAQLLAFDSTDIFFSAFRQALTRSLHVGTPTIDYVAAELAISRITLQRRLSERGTGFQKILDKTRFEMAQMYFENPRLSQTEIASLLAFSEQSAFCRAFQRWSNQTPQHFRKTNK
jgi:AraC-like DNA-binding protein